MGCADPTADAMFWPLSGKKKGEKKNNNPTRIEHVAQTRHVTGGEGEAETNRNSPFILKLSGIPSCWNKNTEDPSYNKNSITHKATYLHLCN